MQEKSWEIKEIPTWVSQKEASALTKGSILDLPLGIRTGFIVNGFIGLFRGTCG